MKRWLLIRWKSFSCCGEKKQNCVGLWVELGFTNRFVGQVIQRLTNVRLSRELFDTSLLGKWCNLSGLSFLFDHVMSDDLNCTSQQLNRFDWLTSVHLYGLSVYCLKHICHLSKIFNSNMTFSDHFKTVCNQLTFTFRIFVEWGFTFAIGCCFVH